MTQEDKKLLLQDLSARLPYGVVCNDNRHGSGRVTNIDITPDIEQKNGKVVVYYFDFDEYGELKNCKPYLRPLSSMTEEEKRHISKMMLLRTYDNGVVYDIPYDVYTPYYVMEDCLNYLRSIHVDYSGLIERGLAIAVTERNNPYKE